MSSRRVLLILSALAFFRSLASAANPEAELILDGEFLQPSSTIEIRFARPMLGRDEVNGGAAESPIIITPALPGHFVWLSRRSGVYLPESAPPLGATYTVTVQPGLKAADQKPIGADLRAVVRTPSFAVRTLATGVYDEENVSPKPEVRIAFNAAVETKAAEGFLKFVAETGEEIAATASYATVGDYWPRPEPEDWEERWRLAHEPAAPENVDKDRESTDRSALNRLEIRPVTNLQSGKKWRLEVLRGLTARSGKYQLAEPFRVELGVVKPFVLTTLTASSYINSGRSLTLEFSRSLAPDIKSESASKYFRIEPAVANLRFEEDSDSLVVRGNFERGKEYHLQIDPAVISMDGQALEGSQSRTFQFEPVRPRLYLPEITGHQIRGGNRTFEVRAANLKSIRVSARLIAPNAVAKAIAAFAKYDRSSEESSGHSEEGDVSNEIYQRLPPDLIDGKLLSEETIELSPTEIDAPQKAILEWDKIVGAQNAGAIFLTVEGNPLVEMGTKRPGAQALIQLTDLGVLWKKVEGELRAYVFSHTSGQPLPGIQVGLLSEELAPLRNATTDSSGWAKIPETTAPGWLVAQMNGDVHALRVGVRGTELPMFAFNIPVDYRPWVSEEKTGISTRAFIFTDRPLYQLGEEVKLKGFVRRSETGAELQPASNGEGVLVLFDPRGEKISEAKIRTDSRGSFDASVKLSSFATGNYSLRLTISGAEDRGAYCGFQVAPYQPNAFELQVATPKRLSLDESLRVPVTAKYFFGAPITKAEARWTLRYLREPFSPDGFSEFRFGRIDESKENALTLRGTEPLTATGMTIQPKLPTPEGIPHVGILTVEVTDANQQTVSETSRFTQDASQFYLGLAEAESSVVNVGQEIITRAVAVQPDGQPSAESMKVRVELIRLRHETVRMQGAGNAITFRTETSEEKIAETAGDTIIPIKRGEFWRPTSQATARFKAEKAGQFRIRVSAKDAVGREVVSESEIFVEGQDAMAWDYRNPAQIELTPDKAGYRAGETARILVKTPISGDALISIEQGEKVLRTMRVHLEGNTPVIEVPVTAADTPNIFASLVILRGSAASTRKFKTPEYRYGACMLRVLNPANRLQVAISPARAEVQPGDEVDADILVRDGLGEPLRDAEVTFFAVDDGILALTGYERPMPLTKFEEPVDLQVRTGLTLFDLLPEDPGDLRFSNKGYLIGGGGTEGPGRKLRRDFPGTACWMPSLRTGADGHVRAHFRAPDALTRYRLVAVANARASMFGSGESAIAIRKPLMIMPALGQFANVGDELIARTLVRNDTGFDGTVKVNLVLDQTAESPQPTVTQVEVRNGEARPIDFLIRFRAIGNAEWKWSARFEAGGKVFEDGVLSKMTVGSPMLVLRETYLNDLRGGKTDLLAGVNPQLQEASGTVALSIANTRLASLGSSAEHLREYPYGCAEQTVSALIPWIVLPQLSPILPRLDARDSDAAIRSGVQKIITMQTSSGGLSFWPGGQRPALFQSAYAAVALGLWQRQGFAVPDGSKKLLEYLSAQLRGTGQLRDETELGERALALFALAISGKPEPSYGEELFQRRAELSLGSRALLAMAVMENHGPSSMVEELLNVHRPAPEGFSFFGGGAREAALQLMAWCQFKPKAGEVARLTSELLRYRRSGRWSTTQENAWALMALARYYTAVERGGTAAQGSLLLGNRTLPFALSKAKPVLNELYNFDGTSARPIIGVDNPRKTALFSEAQFVVHPPLGEQPQQDRGFSMARSYRKLTDDGALQEANDLRVGDRVLVTLRIEATRPGRFVAIDDPLPAIFEAVNPSFATSSVGGAETLASEGLSSYREIRANRVLIFCDDLPSGASTFRYLARVRSAGRVTAPAAKAEEMYQPERFGTTEISHLRSAADTK